LGVVAGATAASPAAFRCIAQHPTTAGLRIGVNPARRWGAVFAVDAVSRGAESGCFTTNYPPSTGRYSFSYYDLSDDPFPFLVAGLRLVFRPIVAAGMSAAVHVGAHATTGPMDWLPTGGAGVQVGRGRVRGLFEIDLWQYRVGRFDVVIDYEQSQEVGRQSVRRATSDLAAVLRAGIVLSLGGRRPTGPN
jgi:hypothetical protein